MEIYDNSLEDLLKNLLQCHPANYVKVLHSKGCHIGCKDLSALRDYIERCTRQLVEASPPYRYAMKTKVFWTLNRVSSWTDHRLACSVCGKPFFKIDVKHALTGYERRACCLRCARALAKLSTVDHFKSLYGVENAFLLPAVKAKLATLKDSMQHHREQTRKKNGTMKASKQEDIAYELLCRMYGARDIARQYKSKAYPFNCDFYIPSHDIYIECNFSLTHGGYFFDPSSKEDNAVLDYWCSKNSKYYDNTILTWTIRDAAKRESVQRETISTILSSRLLNNLRF